jgi:hypothetical protein
MGGAATISSPLFYHRRGGISQQGAKDSYDVKIQKLISSAKNSQIEATQMLLDALVFRCEENIVNTLRIQKEMSEFVQNTLLEDSLLRKIKLFISTKNIPWIKKFRYLQFSTLSFLHRPLMQISRL